MSKVYNRILYGEQIEAQRPTMLECFSLFRKPNKWKMAVSKTHLFLSHQIGIGIYQATLNQLLIKFIVETAKKNYFGETISSRTQNLPEKLTESYLLMLNKGKEITKELEVRNPTKEERTQLARKTGEELLTITEHMIGQLEGKIPPETPPPKIVVKSTRPRKTKPIMAPPDSVRRTITVISRDSAAEPSGKEENALSEEINTTLELANDSTTSLTDAAELLLEAGLLDKGDPKVFSARIAFSKKCCAAAEEKITDAEEANPQANLKEALVLVQLSDRLSPENKEAQALRKEIRLAQFVANKEKNS